MHLLLLTLRPKLCAVVCGTRLQFDELRGTSVLYPTDICSGNLVDLESTNLYIQLFACHFAEGCVRRVERGEFPPFMFPCIRYRFNIVLNTGYIFRHVSEYGSCNGMSRQMQNFCTDVTAVLTIKNKAENVT